MSFPRFRIRSLLIVVAVAAIPLATRDVVSAVALVLMFGVVAIPVMFAPRRHRLEVAAWVAALHPPMVLVYLHVTWITAWWHLGRIPRLTPYQLNPAGTIVDLPKTVTDFAFLSLPISGVAAVFFVPCWIELWHRPTLNPFLILPAVWASTFLILLIDPFGALDWFLG